MKAGVSILVLVACWLLATTPARAQDINTLEEQAALQKLIGGLGNDTFEGRQAAMKQIWNSSHLTPETLGSFADTADPETEARIRRLIELIEMGITPRTSPDVARRIYEFHSADQDDMFSILYELVQLGQHELVMNLINSLDDEYVRDYLASSVFDEDESPIVGLMPRHNGRIDAADMARLDRVMSHPFMWKWYTSDCLVYSLLQDRISQQIEELTADFVGESPSDELRVRLIELLRFDGQFELALEQIEKIGGSTVRQNALRQRVLREAGRWSDLASEYDLNRVGDTGHLARAGEASLLHYWSVNSPAQARWQSKIVADDSAESWNALAAIQLAQLDLPGLLESSKKMTPGVAFEMLCRIEQYEAAFDISGAPDTPDERKVWYGRQLRKLRRKLNLARTRDDEQAQRDAMDLLLLLPTFATCVGELGDVDQAKLYFEMLAERLRNEVSYQSLYWRAQAFDQLARLNVGEDIWHFYESFALHDEVERTVETLFPDSPDQAGMWSEVLRQSIADPVDRTRFVASLLKSPFGEADQQFDIEMLVTLARIYIDRRPPAQRARYLVMLGQTCQLHQRESLAHDLILESGFLGEAAAFTELADQAAARNDWQQALRWARRLQEIDPRTGHRYRIAVYQKQMGDEASFEQEFRRAGLTELHSWNLLETAAIVEESGLADLSATLIDRFLRGITADQADVYWEHQRLATLVQETDPQRAVYHWRQAQLSWTRHLDLSVNNTQRTRYYATQAAMAEAQVALNEGRIEQAGETLLRSIGVSSATTSMLERFVPQLEQAGENQWADRIFDAVLKRFDSVLSEWPNSALHHNNLAWACARCDRHPELRLRHARRAVELEPNNTSYLDTLGEVLLMAGETGQAIELAERCVSLNPYSEHYREQLRRFQAASK